MNPNLLKGELKAMWILGYSDYNHDEFSVLVRYKLAGQVRRLFDWILVPMVRVTIQFEISGLPCRECYISLEEDLNSLFGLDACIVGWPSADGDSNLPIELEVFDHGRRFLASGQDLSFIVGLAELAVNDCQSGHHHILEVA